MRLYAQATPVTHLVPYPGQQYCADNYQNSDAPRAAMRLQVLCPRSTIDQQDQPATATLAARPGACCASKGVSQSGGIDRCSFSTKHVSFRPQPRGVRFVITKTTAVCTRIYSSRWSDLPQQQQQQQRTHARGSSIVTPEARQISPRTVV